MESGNQVVRGWRCGASLLCLALGLAYAPAASAQDKAADASGGDIVVTGSRFGGRVATDSPTPIDTLSNSELTSRAATQLQNMLKVTVPSFSTPRPAAAGASDFLESPTLRNLSTGQVLLLINGKRRHTDATLNINNQVGRGDVAYDFNAIPSLAFKRVEVLRDGAAAQYGSDAIAGVINIVLDDRVGFDGYAQGGATAHGDGQNYTVSAAAGFALPNDGVIRITGQYERRWATDRATDDTRQQYFGTSATGAAVVPSGNYGSGTGLTPSSGTLDPREATIDRHTYVFGAPAYINKAVYVNAKLPISGNAAELYAFGGWNKLDGDSEQFFRRAGQDETVRSIYTDGYRPSQRTPLENWSAAGGVRGALGDLTYDLSSAYGKSIDDIYFDHSVNASLGAASPTSFYRGGFRFGQWTNNLDLAYALDLGDGAPLKLAAGAEYRREFYDIVAGDAASYTNGGATIVGGPNDGKPAPIGSQPTSGVSPVDARSVSRHNVSIYGEVEKTLFDRLLIDGAIRHESYSDFGETTNYKIASRLELVKGFALRGSYGTGFRAPTLAQQYFSQTGVSIVNGQPQTVRIVSVNSPLAAVVGATALKPEKSKNLSVGAVVQAGGLTLSMDYYNIRIDNRIAISSTFSSTGLTALLAANGYSGVSSVAYLTNAVDTTTKGVDLTISYRHTLGDLGKLSATLAANFGQTRFRRIAGTPAALSAIGITSSLFDLTQQVRYTDSVPNEKVTLNLGWDFRRFSASLTNTYYGPTETVALTGKTAAQVAVLTAGYDTIAKSANAAGTSFDIIQRFGGKVVTDLELDYRLTPHVTLAVGADNLFDVFPDKNIASTVASVAAGTNGSDNNGTFPYSYVSPFGVNGATFFGRVRFSF